MRRSIFLFVYFLQYFEASAQDELINNLKENENLDYSVESNNDYYDAESNINADNTMVAVINTKACDLPGNCGYVAVVNIEIFFSLNLGAEIVSLGTETIKLHALCKDESGYLNCSEKNGYANDIGNLKISFIDSERIDDKTFDEIVKPEYFLSIMIDRLMREEGIDYITPNIGKERTSALGAAVSVVVPSEIYSDIQGEWHGFDVHLSKVTQDGKIEAGRIFIGEVTLFVDKHRFGNRGLPGFSGRLIAPALSELHGIHPSSGFVDLYDQMFATALKRASNTPVILNSPNIGFGIKVEIPF